MKLQKEKIIIFLTVLIDVIGIGIVVPVLPFYVESFGVSSFMVTLLFSVFALCSFFSAPLLGALSDRIGRRPVLLVSIASTAIGWFVFGFAKSVWVLFLGRIIDGMAAGNFPIAQSYLVDIARNEKERTTNLGIIGATFGIGFIIGPMLGGILSNYAHALPFFVVGALATLNVIGAYFYLPETNVHATHEGKQKLSLNPFLPLLAAIKDKTLRSRYIIWFMFGLATSIQTAIFALYLNDIFGFGAAAVGYMLAVMGVFIAVNQGVLLKKFWLKHFKESTLEVWVFPLFALGYLFFAAHSLALFIVGFIPVVIGQSLLRVVISSRVAGIAGHKRRGEAMGVMSSVLSLSMVIGPLLAGLVYTQYLSAPFLFAALVLVIAFFVIRLEKNVFGEKHDDAAGVAEAIG
jgi:DHA1 family tetracycline resistance protein-like MFS transporter